ncbi:MAG: riboflavin synthase [Actinomycetota bacterium]|nr:riboflavin synthase [Actinomycetota bacterium]
MFTGIVEELGEVASIEDLGDAVRLAVRADRVTADTEHGDSIAVNGCCLTVVDNHGVVFTADVMRESLDRTSIGRLEPGSPVNLERAVRADTRLGGHIVQGHVDAVGVVLERTPGEHWEVMRVGLPRRLSRYVAEQGSITVDGVSLTVVEVDDTETGTGPSFTVSLIPTTLQLTTLGGRRAGDVVNLEVDVIAKYVERLLGKESQRP